MRYYYFRLFFFSYYLINPVARDGIIRIFLQNIHIHFQKPYKDQCYIHTESQTFLEIVEKKTEQF